MTQSRAHHRDGPADPDGPADRDGPAAIIGGGIGGLTAALSLQHFDVPVRVFEQARALREIGAGMRHGGLDGYPPE